MEFLPLVFISLALVVSHAAVPSEVYWHSVLPNTPMPEAIQDLLPGTRYKDNEVSVGVGRGGVSVGLGGRGPPHVGVHPPYIKGQPWGHSFIYNYAASVDQLKDNPNVALFFLEKDLHPGKKFNLHFTKTIPGARFLPRQVAESIPFSSNKLPEILNRFSVKPESQEARVMKKTIKECEERAVEGEVKYCATSLEAMVDFSVLKLGKDVKAMATEVDKEESEQQKFTISIGMKKMRGEKAVVCHGQNYVYPVFYCHATPTTRVYVVSLVGADGTKAEAVAVCHTNTLNWNPRHLAFLVLKIKPGTVPVCHFLPEDHIAWASN